MPFLKSANLFFLPIVRTRTLSSSAFPMNVSYFNVWIACAVCMSRIELFTSQIDKTNSPPSPPGQLSANSGKSSNATGA
jgi:hypothetical protein